MFGGKLVIINTARLVASSTSVARELNRLHAVFNVRGETMAKLPWSGRIMSVQPRIRLTRSFDQRSHTYLGYCLVIDGAIGHEVRQFSIGVGKAAHQKHQFKVGDGVCGESLPVADDRRAYAFR